MSDDVTYDPFEHDALTSSQASWTRWLPEPIHKAPPPPTQADTLAAKPEDAGIRLKNTLARLRKQAHKQGYDDGYATGHAEGLKQGLAAGHEQGLQDGHREGYEAGHTEGRGKAEKAAQDLATLARECAEALADIETDMGQELISLSVRIAEQVLHRTLQTEPDTLLAVVDDILRMDSGKSAILQLFVNPDDLTLVRDYLNDNPDTSMWRVLPDETITRGGCKARTALGDIDATLEKRWQRVVSAIGGTP